MALLSAAKALFSRRIETLAPVATYMQGIQVDDSSIVKRLIKAYQQAANMQENLGNSMWQLFFNERHVAIHQVFMNEQFESAATILRNPGSTDLFYGIDNLASSLLHQFSSCKNVYTHAVQCLAGLVRFAEAIGAARIENPEGANVPPTRWNTDEVLKRIELTLGQTIAFPNPYPNEHGVYTSRGVVSFRAPQALYQAWRIKRLLKNVRHPRVLEIGAGIGRTAYYARMLGIEDYTIVDLPITSLASGYFLARTLGEDQVLLLGENVSDPERRIKFLSPAGFLSSTDYYDLIINADSLTEMDPKAARAYWTRIEATTGIFLSINHETNPFTVKELIDGSKQAAQAERMPYWMRCGYVEEVVRFISSNR